MIPLPNKKYKIIYADPPWKYNDRNCNGNALNHYNTLSLKELKEIPIKDIQEEDSILFIWVTYPMLKEGIELIETWGYKYKTIGFQWIKLNKKNNKEFFGLGRWTRGNTECCLIGIKGKIKREDNSISQIIKSPIREHSRKPDIVREKIIKLVGNGSKIELFARTKIEGWDIWGNEIQEEEQQIIKEIN